MLQGFPYKVTRAAWWFLLFSVCATSAYVCHKLATIEWLGAARESTAAIFESARLDNLLLLVHASFALPPLVIGIWEFVPRLRKGAWLKYHRWFGTAYVVGIFVSSTTGFLMALHNPHGWIARAGFATLAVFWFTTTYFAYTTARRRDIAAHRRWMIRSYGITLAVVSVRFLAKPRFGVDPEVWYPLMTWICWVPNYVVAELYVRSTDYLGRVRLGRDRKGGRSSDARSRNGLATQATLPVTAGN